MAELTPAERETMKALYRLSQTEPTVRAGDLVDTLGLSPATITSRLRRIDKLGLALHTPYQGVRLTDEGRRVSVAAIRRHRIVERFLSDMLGYAWDQADRLAVTFEHQLPSEVVQRIFIALDRPATCPHGFPIPKVDADDIPALPTLADVPIGGEVEVAVPGDTHPEVVAFLATIGIFPGARVTVREHHPFDGPLVVDISGTDRVIGHKLAREIYVATRQGDDAEP